MLSKEAVLNTTRPQPQSLAAHVLHPSHHRREWHWSIRTSPLGGMRWWYKTQRTGHLNKQRFVPAPLNGYRSFLLLLTLQTTEFGDFLRNHLFSFLFSASWRPGAWRVKEKLAIWDRASRLAQSNPEPSSWWDREPSQGVLEWVCVNKGLFSLTGFVEHLSLSSSELRRWLILTIPALPALTRVQRQKQLSCSSKTSGRI